MGQIKRTAEMHSSLKGGVLPSLTLALLAPLIAEVLSGATRLSFIFVLVPEIMVWGCGALIIRELVRRWRGGPYSMVLLALALAVAEEWIIQQTSLAPLPWVAVQYGRQWHVNWIWFLYFLGYESVWVVLIPVQLAELIFRDRRDRPWLSRRALRVCSLIFVIGSFFAWFLWTQIARPKTFHVAKYQPPFTQLIIGIVIIASLAIAAYLLRNLGTESHQQRPAPAASIAALAAIVLAAPWYVLLWLNFGLHRHWPFWMPMIGGSIWAGCAWAIIWYWTSSERWSDRHRLALCFGATAVAMAFGFSGCSKWPHLDLVAKSLLNVAAVVIFAVATKRLNRGHTPGR